MRETLYDYCQKRNNTVLLWQWDPVQNGDLTPEKISYGSKQKVWWRCEDGHRWQASVTACTCNESGCPYCMGRRPIPGENDLAHRHPELVAQWHPTKNGSLRPDQILPGSHQRAWWICEKGHVWSATVKSRVSGCGCPVCANREAAACENDLATTHPLLAAQWHPTRNGTLTPRDLVAGTHKKVCGCAKKGMHGRHLLFQELRAGQGALSVPAEKSWRAKTIWHPSFPRSRPSGIQATMVHCFRSRWRQPATAASGGYASWAIRIRRQFPPARCTEAAAPIARASGCLQDLMIWRRCGQSWPASGSLL